MKRNLALWLALSGLGVGANAVARPLAFGESSRLLDEILRLTKGGFSDQTVLAFVKARRADIPLILTTEDFLRLRKTGVAETVISYLSGASAIELDTAGRTAAMDSEPVQAPVSPPEAAYAPYPDVASYGGYVSPVLFPVHDRFRRHHHMPHRPPPVPEPASTTRRTGPNGFPILAPGGTPLPIGSNGLPVLDKAPGS
ncbi:MAG: hypothetical protein L3J97_07745 [Thermoplasmata archaeon]|nr:hypothetical protein [Thermoplasmata archaeon]